MEGKGRYEATLEAVNLRLRPIVMTSFAFILGVVPLVISEGAGAEMRRTLGTAVFGGMLGVTLFGIFLTPVFYYVIEWINDQWRGRTARAEKIRGLFRRVPRPLGRKTMQSASGNGKPRRARPHVPVEMTAMARIDPEEEPLAP
jgi:hypothetical protein